MPEQPAMTGIADAAGHPRKLPLPWFFTARRHARRFNEHVEGLSRLIDAAQAANAARAVRSRVICGTVEVRYSDTADCTCCPGAHVAATGILLDEFPHQWPKHMRPEHDPRLWLGAVYPLADLEGRRIRLTAELLT